MTNNKNNVDIWVAGSLFIWMAVFMIGLFPESFFWAIRELGHVTTQRAMINSPWMVTLSCAGYLGWFTYRRCIECNDDNDVALGKSTQIIILALAAFLPLHIERITMYFSIPDAFYRYLILSVVACKSLAWLYLVALILRYYLVSGQATFEAIPLIFPSALNKKHNDSGGDSGAVQE